MSDNYMVVIDKAEVRSGAGAPESSNVLVTMGHQRASEVPLAGVWREWTIPSLTRSYVEVADDKIDHAQLLRKKGPWLMVRGDACHRGHQYASERG